MFVPFNYTYFMLVMYFIENKSVMIQNVDCRYYFNIFKLFSSTQDIIHQIDKINYIGHFSTVEYNKNVHVQST